MRTMTHSTRLRQLHLFMLLLFSLIVACSRAPDSSRVGVFAATQSGLKEVTIYGEECYDDRFFCLSPTQTFQPFGVVSRLYVNLPGAVVVSSRLLWTNTLRRAGNDFVSNRDGAELLNLSTRAVKDNLYELSAADLSNRRTGFLLLEIKMPLGTRTRTYVLQIT
jgi:hypothetical protein